MVPRTVVALPLALLLLAGCVGLPSLTAAPAEPLPERPNTLTNQSVSNYTTAYESTTIYNRVREHNPIENEVSCRSDARIAGHGEFVQTVQCTGGIPLSNGEHIDVAANSHYYVTESVTKRVGARNSHTERYAEYQSDGPDLTSYTVVNFANENATVRVEFDRNESEPSLRFAYILQPNRSVVQTGIPLEYGTTRTMRLQVGDENTTGEFTSQQVIFASPTVIYLLPEDRVRITHGPSMIRNTTE